ncbi:MAG: Glu/Leu/Phe/Val dehydrogenase dimerization domain-containing protein [Bacteroidota bacterium]|nr:Glu/Leu/Phe/Val dehydrogenase dimerization domain-containing protein [Bacteroidota bacterium]
MENLLKKFENTPPELIFKWEDHKTNAKGWIVINSLRGGAAAGGTRMRIGVTKEEVLALAKTMEIKFTVSGPSIGGGKSGINFDPKDPNKKDVLKRWFQFAKPILKKYYGTGGDMNVDEVDEVIPMCEELGIHFPLEGVINGHFKTSKEVTQKLINQLQQGVPLVVQDLNLTPNPHKRYTVGDLITGFGVAQSIINYYKIYGGELRGKRVIVQGWGNVAGAAAYYLAQEEAIIVGIIDKNGGIINPDGYSFQKIKDLIEKRSSNFLEDENILSFKKINQEIWSINAEIFIPAAASRLVTQEQIELMINNKLELISSGANVPFADKEIFFGPIARYADKNISVIPDFISNCGMARAFSYFMQENVEMTDIAIFEAVTNTIKEALEKTYKENTEKNNITRTAFDIALRQLT